MSQVKALLPSLATAAVWIIAAAPLFHAYRLRRKFVAYKNRKRNEVANVRYKILSNSLSDRCIEERHLVRGITCGNRCTTYIVANICDFFDSARHSAIIAMNMLTLREVAAAILRAHERGVEVRILCDINKAAVLVSKNKQFALKGIPVKMNVKDGTEIHCKFCIVDAGEPTAKMMFGSMNLTLQAVSMNQEIIGFTNNPAWISMYSKAFDELWPQWINYKQ